MLKLVKKSSNELRSVTQEEMESLSLSTQALIILAVEAGIKKCLASAKNKAGEEFHFVPVEVLEKVIEHYVK